MPAPAPSPGLPRLGAGSATWVAPALECGVTTSRALHSLTHSLTPPSSPVPHQQPPIGLCVYEALEVQAEHGWQAGQAHALLRTASGHGDGRCQGKTSGRDPSGSALHPGQSGMQRTRRARTLPGPPTATAMADELVPPLLHPLQLDGTHTRCAHMAAGPSPLQARSSRRPRAPRPPHATHWQRLAGDGRRTRHMERHARGPPPSLSLACASCRQPQQSQKNLSSPLSVSVLLKALRQAVRLELCSISSLCARVARCRGWVEAQQPSATERLEAGSQAGVVLTVQTAQDQHGLQGRSGQPQQALQALQDSPRARRPGWSCGRCPGCKDAGEGGSAAALARLVQSSAA